MESYFFFLNLIFCRMTGSAGRRLGRLGLAAAGTFGAGAIIYSNITAPQVGSIIVLMDNVWGGGG